MKPTLSDAELERKLVKLRDGVGNHVTPETPPPGNAGVVYCKQPCASQKQIICNIFCKMTTKFKSRAHALEFALALKARRTALGKTLQELLRLQPE